MTRAVLVLTITLTLTVIGAPLAIAQPSATQPQPQPQPPQDPAQPVDPVAACEHERATRMRTAQATADIDERTRILQSLPDCTALAATQPGQLDGGTPADRIAACEHERAMRVRTAQATADIDERTRILQSLPDCTALAATQPGQPDGGTTDRIAACKHERAMRMRTAQATADIDERTRILQSLPDCTAVVGGTPADRIAACKHERATRMRTAQATTDIDERTRILQSLPDCTAQQVTGGHDPAVLAACQQERAVRIRNARTTPDLDERTRILQSLPDCVERPVSQQPDAGRAGGTSEVGIGLGIASGGGDSLTGLAFHLGFGSFVSKNAAISLRIATTLLKEGDAVFVIGFMGPHVQAWVGPQGWVGGGLGIAFFGGCGGGGCGTEEMLGVDLRAGYALSKTGRGTNLGLEITRMTDFEVTTISFTIGHQGF